MPAVAVPARSSTSGYRCRIVSASASATKARNSGSAISSRLSQYKGAQRPEALAETIRQRYPDVELLAGTATAGIPHAAWVADRLRLPMVYVRPQPKEHGRGRQVEGRLIPGARTVLIEDLISTGSSSIRAAEALRREKAHMRGIVAIFSYSLPGTAARLAEAGLSAVALCGLEALLQQARRMGLLSEAQESLLRDWYRDPESWSRHYEQIHESGRSIHRG
jgi:orotate phosphoribosyltransferase